MCSLNQTQVVCLNRTSGLVDFSNCVRQRGGLGASNENALKDIVDWPQPSRDGYELTDVNTVVNSFAVSNGKVAEG